MAKKSRKSPEGPERKRSPTAQEVLSRLGPGGALAATRPGGRGRFSAADRRFVLRARRLVGELREAVASPGADAHRIGVLLQAVVDERLYRAFGYGSFHALLEDEGLMSRVTANKLMTLARTFRPEQLHALGTEKAYAVVAFAAAADAPKAARILVEKDAVIGSRPISESPVKEILAEARRVRAATGRARRVSKEVQAAREVAAGLENRLRARGAKDATVAARRSGGRWRLAIDLGLRHAGALLPDAE